MRALTFVLWAAVLVFGSGCVAHGGGAADAGGDATSGRCVPTPMPDAAMPDAAVVSPSCEGFPAPCSTAIDQAACARIEGCGYGACAGTPPDCHGRVTTASCEEIAGCTWSGGICRGAPSPCATHADMVSCASAMGCAWGTTATCSGTSTRCVFFDAATCASQPGCTFGPPDTGVPPTDAAVAPDAAVVETDYTLCDGTCSDLLWDARHCGSCGNACPTTHRCVQGTCRTGHGCEGCRCFCVGGEVGVLACAGAICNSCEGQCSGSCDGLGGLIGVEGACW